MGLDFAAWSRDALADVDGFLDGVLDTTWPDAFLEPLRYPVFGGGKRVRPLLTLAAFEAVGGRDRARCLPAAAAVELVHTYSLAHDDLPSMDDDDMRRGRPTLHKVWTEGTAVLVGDALLTEAFAVLAAAPLSDATRVALVRALAHAAGHRGMVGGQAADIGLGGPVTDLDTLLRLHRGKTGALIHAAVRMGGLSAGADDDELARLDAYGWAVGLAFQLADDVLDAEQDEGADGPPSYVKLLGVDETTRRALALADDAIAAVQRLPGADALVAIARFTVDRSS
jgi:geranylgeranyl diphosphate synthase type II